MRRTALLLALIARALFAQEAAPAVAVSGASAGGDAFDYYALQRVARISDPRLSPDGARIAFVVGKVSLSANAVESNIWVTSSDGGTATQITFDGDTNSRPRWSPDSSRLAYISNRSGSSQIWTMNADGSGAKQLTELSTEADGVLFSPDGERLVYLSRVFPACAADDACNARRLEEAENDPVKARIFERLLYRHWTAWDDGRRSHLFSLSLAGEAEPIDLTPGTLDVPPFSLGGPDGYDISPDGQEVCYELKAGLEQERSTNIDLWTVPIQGGRPTQVTRNPAADVSPAYSPDGRFLAYRAQERPGYESDRFRLFIQDRSSGEAVPLTDTLDRWVTSLAWSPDSTRLFFTAEDRGRQPIYTVRASGGPTQVAVYGDAHHDDVQLRPDGKSMIYSASSGSRPVEIYRAFSGGGQPERLTHINDQLLDRYKLDALEEVSYLGRDGAALSGFVAKPPNFNLESRYPLLVLIHGGPQGAWGEDWSYRWNPQVFAAAGFVVFMPNPRGSTGYGQAFTDAVRSDWGGKAFDDIIAGVDSMLARPYVDATRVAAAGASYGGYMIDWMLGHTDRFNALVSHDGVYDLKSFFGSTEELWFPLWDLEGPPWDRQEQYEKWSPSSYVKNFKTPTLVVHGQLDYRVPVTQGMQLFTALQMRDVPSKFLYFPDEGHWVTKPRNSILWHQTVIEWLQRWTKPGATAAPAANAASRP